MSDNDNNNNNDNNGNNPENSPVVKLKNALDQLYASRNLVEEAFSDFESQDLPKENEKLRESVKILTEKLENTEKILLDLKNDRDILEKNFREELTQKQAALFAASDRQMQAYLAMRLDTETVRLNYLKSQLNQRLEYMLGNMRFLDDNERGGLQMEINMLAQKINYQNEIARQRVHNAWTELLSDKSKAIEEMQKTEIEDKTLRAVKNFFNWESFFGLRLISSLGILLIIIGVFTFGRYVYLQMNNEMQCACIFAVGLIFLVAGEILNKKWRGVFSLALTAGGSAILFLATALGYLTLQVLPMQAALGICAGASVISFVLAIRHNSQTISIFALIGGYLPILALNADSVIWAIIYFTILNLYSFALATRKNWSVSRFIGLFAGLIAELIIIILVGIQEYYVNWDMTRIAVISCVAIAYIAYLIIPVFGAMFTKTKIKAADIILLSCNIFFRFLLALYAISQFIFMRADMDKYHTFVSVFFALTCICMAVLSERGAHKSIPEKDRGSLRALFFITSVTFAALIVLFWFDRVWFSSGWLIEGTGLFLHGILRNRKRFTIAGSIVGGVCVCGFLLINAPNYASPLFVWQYLLVTLGLLSAFIVLAVKKIPQKDPSVQIFQAGAAFNVWIFFVYLFNNPIHDYLWKLIYKPQDIIVLSCIIFGMLYSYVLPKIRAVYCTGIQITGIIIGAISIIWLFWFNAFSGNILRDETAAAIKILIMALYIMTNLIGILWMRDLLQFMILKKALPLKFYPLLLSGYFVSAVSHNLVVQLELQASSMILTVIFGVTALCWIIFGFAKRNNIIRVFGLSLSFFSVIKLFVLDLWDLSTELKIVSYFIMGVLLLAISFIYQYFNKKLKESENN